MPQLLILAWRNVFRQRRRSLLTGLTMAGGFALLSLSVGVSDGTYDTAIKAFTSAATGHVQIHARGYLEKPTLFTSFENAEAVGRRAASVRGVRSWAPRVYSGALAFIGKKTTVARLVGVDPVREAQTTRLSGRVSQGKFLSSGAAKEVMIGAGLAELLKAGVGDDLVLITQAADGSVANDLFRIVAVLKGGSMLAGDSECYLPLAAAQEFLAMQGRVHELAVVLDDFSRSRQAAREIAKALDDPALEVDPWEVVAQEFYRAMIADKEGMWITLLIIVLIVAIGVLNTVLMSVLERTREYGVMKALGTRPARMFALILLETGWLALLSCAVGGLAGLAANLYLANHGIPYPAGMDMGGVVVDTMYGSLRARGFLISGLVTFGTAVLVAMIPAARVVRLRPVEAIRT
ncbi:MAG: ABC transporter permease [candidate division FCPU426 bacterium]